MSPKAVETMTDPKKPDDDSDWGTHIQNPNDVWKNESPREKFDDGLDRYRWWVAGLFALLLTVLGIVAKCSYK